MSATVEKTVPAKRFKRKELPQKAFLDECFDYNPWSGELRWKRRPLSHFKNSHACNIWNAKNPGRIAGNCMVFEGQPHYINIRLDPFGGIGAHVLIWVMISGKSIPDGLYVDHINGVKNDNSFENLRLSTNQQNNFNVKRKTGYLFYRNLPRGVSPSHNGLRFRAKIRVNYKEICLGWHDSPELAHEAYLAAYHKHAGEFVHHSVLPEATGSTHVEDY